jgi:uncharacterized protein with HEPN domain
MPRKYKLYLKDIIEAASKVQRYTESITKFAEFKTDEFTIDAVLHNLMIIGEAERNIPSEIKEKYPEVDWKGAKHLRNLIAHVYFALNIHRIWDFIQNDIASLKAQIENILSDLESEETTTDG